MKNKILRWITIIMCFASVLMVSALFYLPDKIKALENRYEAGLREAREREERFELLASLSGIDYLEMVTRQMLQARQEQNVEVDEDQSETIDETPHGEEASELPFDSQLRIEMPPGVDFSQIEFTNDYVNKNITFKIPGAGEAYLVEYPMLGDSKHIETLDFNYEKDGLSAKLHMDGIYEPVIEYDERFIYLDFADPHDIYDYIIVVDAGHGGDQPGAVRENIYEKHITLPMVKKIKEVFDADTEHNIGVYYTRLTDINIPFADRIGLANDLNANFFISIHINALPNNTTTQGLGVMYNEKNPGGKHGNKNLSEILLASCLNSLKCESKNLFNGSTIYILHHAEVPASLIEVGFISNPQEREKLLTDEYQYKLAQGVYEGALDAIEKGY